MFPDPILSLNVYCSGGLDEIVQRGVAPFWSENKAAAGGGAYLWLMRYAKGGEHLKIRLHGGPEAAALAGKLGAAIDRCLALLEPAAPDQARKSLPRATPIDLEDGEPAEPPDRSWRIVAYRRSPISLGPSPYLEDHAFVARLTSCFGAGTEFLLEQRHGASGKMPPALLQSLMLKILVAALGGFGLAAAERDAYLLYHRDWILRSIAKRTASRVLGQTKTAQLLLRFGEEVTRLGSLATDRLAAIAAEGWSGEIADRGDTLSLWGDSLRELRNYSETFSGDLPHQIDPFAGDPLFPPLFKALHGFANQLGLDALNEAFAYHFLLQAAGDDPALKREPVLLRPRL